MNNYQQNELEHKKKQLKLKLQVTNFVRNHIQDWLPVMDTIVELNCQYQLKHLACIDLEELPFWETELNKEPILNYSFKISDLLITNSDPVHKSISEYYPTMNPLRYVPNLPLKITDNNDWKSIALAVEELNINPDEEVLFFYLNFSPVLTLSLTEIISFKQDPIYFPENMVICHKNYDWMIYRTLEDDWNWGVKG